MCIFAKNKKSLVVTRLFLYKNPTTMKKRVLLLLCFGLMLNACNQKQTEEQNVNAEANITENQAEAAADDSNFVPDIPTGEIIVITEEEFFQRVATFDDERGLQYKGTYPAIVDFYADWCRPCHALTPTLVELAKEYKGKVIIYKLNVDRAAEVSSIFQINSIPSLVFFKPNAQPAKMVGASPKADIVKAINDLLLNE